MFYGIIKPPTLYIIINCEPHKWHYLFSGVFLGRFYTFVPVETNWNKYSTVCYLMAC